MKRLTTDDSKSILCGLNLFFAKDGEVWIRGGGPEPDYPDFTLTDWINRAAAVQGIELGADDAESLGDVMYDWLQYGVDATEGVLALLHAAAVQAAEMRGRLEMIEEILGDNYDLGRLRELVDAARAGRCVVFKFGIGSTVYRPWVRPDGSHPFVSEEKMNTVQDLVNAELWPDAHKTREAAEAALRDRNGGAV